MTDNWKALGLISALALIIIAGSVMVVFTAIDGRPVKAGFLAEPAVPEKAEYRSPNFSSNAYFSDSSFPAETAVVQEARKYLGVGYLFGGEYARDGKVDCSSFVQLVFAALGSDLPRTTYEQVELGKPVALDDLRRGDLVFFENTSEIQTGVTHEGIYIGNGDFIHASGRIGQVAITPLSDPFYRSHYYTARRILY